MNTTIHTIFATLAASALISTTAIAQEPAAVTQTVPSDFTDIVAELSPAVVAISATRPAQSQQMQPDNLPAPFGLPGIPRSPGQQQRPEGRAMGSGFLIDEEGHIVTNNHVVQDASEVEVLLQDGTRRGAEMVGTDPDEEITLSIRRDGEAREVQLTLAQRDAPQATASVDPDSADLDQRRMGVAVAPLPQLLRRQLELEGEQGLIVQNLQAGSPAAEAGIRQGDVILEADGEAIANVDELASAWRSAMDDDQPMLLSIVRDQSRRFVAVETGEG